MKLAEGDLFYVPAGTWTSIHPDTDSVFLIFSMENISLADFICDSLKHILNSEPHLRQKITFTDSDNLKAQLAEALNIAGEYLQVLNPDIMVPPSLICPRHLLIDLDNDEQFRQFGETEQMNLIHKDMSLLFNPLAIMV